LDYKGQTLAYFVAAQVTTRPSKLERSSLITLSSHV
jgi:hypothetical protein